MDVVRLGELDRQGELPESLTAVTIPRELHHGFVVLESLDTTSIAGLVLFARDFSAGLLGMDASTREIVEVQSGTRRTASPHPDEFASLTAQMQEWLAARGTSAPSERVGAFRDGLQRSGFASLDDPDGYWAALLDDIAIGDYDEPDAARA